MPCVKKAWPTCRNARSPPPSKCCSGCATSSKRVDCRAGVTPRAACRGRESEKSQRRQRKEQCMSGKDKQRVVIVTGAGHGIGAATARWLAREGWQVMVADKDAAATAAIAAEIGTTGTMADVSEEADIATLVNATLSVHGRLAALVSNAGVSRFASLRETKLSDWNEVIATNLTAAFLLAKYAEDALRAARGAMVLVSSTRAHMSAPDTHAYSATKGGLVALTHALAISLGPDVRIICFFFGWFVFLGVFFLVVVFVLFW